MKLIQRPGRLRATFIGLITIVLILIAVIPYLLRPGIPDGLEEALVPVDRIGVPAEAVIVGLGEATHGNKEFWDIRRSVLSQLVDDGFRTVILEADFGGALVANAFVQGGAGTSEDAARALGFAVYRTQEVADFLQWIRDYNLNVPAERRISFYGCDVQRYDHNKTGLFVYLDQVAPDVSANYKERLADLNDATVFDQERDKIQAGLAAMGELLSTMEQQRDAYIAATSEEAYELAHEYANSLRQHASLRSGIVPYNDTRDGYMAEKVQWIERYANRQHASRILLLGHNGHIDKTSAAGYRSLGNHLAEAYGERYFAIATEYTESRFISKSAFSGEREMFHAKNGRSSRLAYSLAAVTDGPDYLDFSRLLEQPELAKWLAKDTRISMIGDEYSRWLGRLPQFRTLKLTPAEAFDGLIYIKHASPTTMLNN